MHTLGMVSKKMHEEITSRSDLTEEFNELFQTENLIEVKCEICGVDGYSVSTAAVDVMSEDVKSRILFVCLECDERKTEEDGPFSSTRVMHINNAALDRMSSLVGDLMYHPHMVITLSTETMYGRIYYDEDTPEDHKLLEQVSDLIYKGLNAKEHEVSDKYRRLLDVSENLYKSRKFASYLRSIFYMARLAGVDDTSS